MMTIEHFLTLSTLYNLDVSLHSTNSLVCKYATSYVKGSEVGLFDANLYSSNPFDLCISLYSSLIRNALGYV